MPDEIVTRILQICGNQGKCRAPECGRQIWWMKTRAGKEMPFDADGRVHWETCPAAKEFRKPKAPEPAQPRQIPLDVTGVELTGGKGKVTLKP